MKRDTLKSLYDVHSWAGFIVGIALFVVCTSGAIAVFNPEIDQWANPALQVTEIGPVRVDADAALETLSRAAPIASHEAAYFYLPADMHGLYGLSAPTEADPQRKLYVNAYTGAMTAPRNNHVYNFLRHLHVRFLLDSYGRLVVGLIGMAMLVSIITGVLIYKHIFRDFFRMRWRKAKNPRLTLADFHRLIGVWALAFHLIIGATGAWLGLEGYATDAVANAQRIFARNEVSSMADPPVAIGGPEPAPMASVALMVTRAEAVIPQFEPTNLELENWGTTAAKLTVRGDLPGLIQKSSAWVSFDAATATRLEIYDVRQKSVWTQLRYALEPLHYGYYGGVWLKICYLILGLLPAVLSVTGALIWFERRRRPTPDTAVAAVRERECEAIREMSA